MEYLMEYRGVFLGVYLWWGDMVVIDGCCERECKFFFKIVIVWRFIMDSGDVSIDIYLFD